ncbi:hypothetical protein DXT66_03225 [Nocardia farcinica]|nr:hypothetical protein DXT66_03225 [Nocardia farcinica]
MRHRSTERTETASCDRRSIRLRGSVFGDSNTFGQPAGERGRWPIDVRWTGRLRRILGTDYAVIEEGLARVLPRRRRRGPQRISPPVRAGPTPGSVVSSSRSPNAHRPPTPRR